MALTRRQMITMTAGAFVASALPAFGGQMFQLSGRAFGTTWQARLRGRGNPEALARVLAAVLARIDLSMSPFRPDSEISSFNRAPAGRHPVGEDFARVTVEALRVAAISDGVFDPSVGPDVGRYGFGPIHGKRVGSFADLATDGSAIAKAKSMLTLDLCGIAKGFALDQMVDHIAAAGYADFVVELGGEVLARGADAAGAPWRIGISNPSGGLHSTIDAKGLAVATSGDAINAYEVKSRRYSHIIDPATDEPVVNSVASVTVLSPSAMTADALATALMVMGPSKGMAFARLHALPVLYLLREAGGVRAYSNRSFDSHRVN